MDIFPSSQLNEPQVGKTLCAIQEAFPGTCTLNFPLIAKINMAIITFIMIMINYDSDEFIE